MSFVHDLPEAEKMELLYEVTYRTYQEAFLFSLVIFDQGDVLAVEIPSKKSGIWKGKCEVMEHNCSDFQKEMDGL